MTPSQFDKLTHLLTNQPKQDYTHLIDLLRTDLHTIELAVKDVKKLLEEQSKTKGE